MVRVAEPLLTELSAASAETGLPLAAQARKILVEWAAERVAGRNESVAA